MNLLKCHLHYLFTKSTVIILLLTTFAFGFIFLGNANINHSIRTEVIYEYLINSSFVYKVLFSFIAIFIFANSIYDENDFYAYFILTNMKRRRYIIAKIITNVLVIIFLSVLIFILFLLIGLISIKGFYMQSIFISTFMNLTLIALIYGFYAFLLMQLFNNQFINIIVFGLLIISNNLDFEDLPGKILLFLIPNDNSYGLIHLIYLLIILFIINIYIYEKKELHY